MVQVPLLAQTMQECVPLQLNPSGVGLAVITGIGHLIGACALAPYRCMNLNVKPTLIECHREFLERVLLPESYAHAFRRARVLSSDVGTCEISASEIIYWQG